MFSSRDKKISTNKRTSKLRYQQDIQAAGKTMKLKLARDSEESLKGKTELKNTWTSINPPREIRW